MARVTIVARGCRYIDERRALLRFAGEERLFKIERRARVMKRGGISVMAER